MQRTRELRGLQRRWRWLLSEAHLVQREIDLTRVQNSGTAYTINYKEQIEEELDDLEYVFRYLDRTRNGYHLNKVQALTLALALIASFLLSILLARGGL